ncbi:NAD-dependent epimerase/dehydratase family protein [Roseateles amylovorans]|uniref:NAD-dependent epimerase/dehydratase family protein n=1 Tax=Roseateles amylovorans TaxID=2978473 RepID=A0ABY6AXJ4_9BURK|nr:NAD-dependent epimerase/dehydratase family protein [Roseateles amylovorans]UXH77633.1 NAD-dependent epimerase/dehydratase family protein [Roseateles amylovorans]
MKQTSLTPSPTVLITGGAGFLGQACARRFRVAGWRVVGLGHGRWTDDEALAAGYDRWVNAGVTAKVLDGLADLGQDLHAVAHCASNGSVPYSLEQPLDAYERTVGSTVVLLDYLRRHAPTAVVLYPSSAAVYGAAPDRPLHETDAPNPVSPYGFHKQMVETLLAAHATCFGQPAVAVRFFSIYGPGLRKQLLWDASGRLLSGESPLTFFGTGEETRDWIHVDDAAALMLRLAERARGEPTGPVRLDIVNGASGERVTVREVLERLALALGSSAEICFNGTVRAGDPRFYHAAIHRMHAAGWSTSITLDQGLAAYALWARNAHLPAP